MIPKIKHVKIIFALIAFFGFFTFSLMAQSKVQAIESVKSFKDLEPCTYHILKAEEKRNIPSGLLLALSLVETNYQGRPHPYAVHINGRSYYADSVENAKKLVRHKDGSFKRNSSVGCMQLQITYHKGAFSSMDEMLNPEANVNYGANYLEKHYKRYGSWAKAVQRYNGGKKRQKRAYLCQVYHTLKAFNQTSADLIKQPYCSTKRKSPYVSLATREAFYNAQKL